MKKFMNNRNTRLGNAKKEKIRINSGPGNLYENR